MADNIKGIPFSTDDEGISFPDLAKDIVRTVTDGEVYVVWFAYVLGAWKAVCSTDLPDGRYYEVTHKPDHDGSDGAAATYLDTYVKIDNQEVDLT